MVVLPAPFGPRSPTTSPLWTSTSTPSTTFLRPNDFVRFSHRRHEPFSFLLLLGGSDGGIDTTSLSSFHDTSIFIDIVDHPLPSDHILPVSNYGVSLQYHFILILLEGDLLARRPSIELDNLHTAGSDNRPDPLGVRV